MALILSCFYCEFYILICIVIRITNAAFFIPYQTPADCVKLSDGAATSLYFNTVQLKCTECEQPSTAQTVTPDGAFGCKKNLAGLKKTGTNCNQQRLTFECVPVFFKLAHSLKLKLTLCGLISHQGGLGLGGSVHEEAHPCFPYLIQTSFKGIDARSIHHPLVQLIPSINHSV